MGAKAWQNRADSVRRSVLPEIARILKTNGILQMVFKRDIDIATVYAEIYHVLLLSRTGAAGRTEATRLEQTGSVSQELADRKSRLKKDLERLLSQTAIEQKFQAALAELDGDLEQALFKIWKQNPSALNRILRFIYEKGSVDLKSKGSPRWGDPVK